MAKRRKAGEGTLTKRKDGRWEARVVVSYDEKGMPKTKNVTAVSKAKCLEKLEKLKAELGAVTRKCSPNMPIGEWMDFWYQTYCKNTLKESTQATYEQWKDIDFETGTLSVTKQVRYVKGELKIEPPKTKASERSIILSPPILEMLAEYRKTVDSIWLFPSPVKDEDVPRDPSACRKALARILKRAECEHVPFHAMRHTFASNAFHYGMDVKTLASTIGHESVETTLNVYAHSSEQMKRDAAKKIDEAIGTVLGADVTASDASCGDENGEAQEPTNDADKPKTVEFKPYQPKYRKRGTGSVHQVSKNVWEGRYTPTVNGKRIARNIYADSEEECEIMLEALIKEMKAEFGIK